MAEIVAVGLGPGARGHVTREAEGLIERAAQEERLVLRTRIHPTVEAWPALAAAPSLDAHYESAGSFEETYARIAADVVAR
ncbi:MAG TPA: tetrapyrrole methylase, partial [Chloroflexota bacterium]|nr:tetrapyrrole methylase [Chloroflexota bacterium]